LFTRSEKDIRKLQPCTKAHPNGSDICKQH